MSNTREVSIHSAPTPIQRRRFLLTATLTTGLLITGTTQTGCSPFSSDAKAGAKKESKWSWFKKKEYQEPRSMVAIWTEDTLVAPGKPVTRGFGGRIYFYNEKNQAIPVDGELVVYGFDESTRNMTQDVRPEADRRFRYTAEQFTTHFSESDLGASYSVWLPWEADGGMQREITLIPTFTSKSAKIIRGESSKVLLTGKKSSTPTRETLPGMPPPMQPLLGANSPTNQVQTASATMPTNGYGYLPGPTIPSPSSFAPSQMTNQTFENMQGAALTPMRTTTIELSKSSSIFNGVPKK